MDEKNIAAAMARYLAAQVEAEIHYGGKLINPYKGYYGLLNLLEKLGIDTKPTNEKTQRAVKGLHAQIFRK